MLVVESPIYKYLIQVKSWVNNFRDSYDIYHLITGYYKAMILPDVVLDFEQKWIYDFSFFIENELKHRYAEKNLGGHWGNLLLDGVDGGNEESINLFYSLLDEFVLKYESKKVNGKLQSNIQRYNF